MLMLHARLIHRSQRTAPAGKDGVSSSVQLLPRAGRGPLTRLCTAPPPPQLCWLFLLAALGGREELHPALLALCWCRVGSCGPEGPLKLVDCRLGRGGVSSP